MRKIRLNLFEGIAACTIFPNIGLLLTTFILIVSLFVQQSPVVYKAIGISYLASVSLLGISLIICLIVNFKSKYILFLEDRTFTFCNKTFAYDDVFSAEYCLCKWYAIPFVPLLQAAGQVEIKLKNGKRISFRVMYKDYLILKSKIMNIHEIKLGIWKIYKG